jgi:hypothetical protein
VPQKLRLAQLGGQPLVGGEVGVDAADVAEHQPVVEAIDVGADLELEVAAPLRQVVQLAALAQAALGLLGSGSSGELPAHQRQRQRFGVLGAPRHLHRLDPDLVRAPGRVGPIERLG